MQQKKTLGYQPPVPSFEPKARCPLLQPSYLELSEYIRDCIMYSPETFSSHNQLCRRAEAAIQAQRARNPIECGLKALDAEKILPPREICTTLATAYFDTWEKLYRVIHLPSFWKIYRDICTGFRQSSLSFRILTLAVLILGKKTLVKGLTDDPEAIQLNNQRLSQWTHCVENYCVLLVENKRLDLTGIQILCLYTLHKATTDDRNGAIRWTQRLVKCAIQASLHVDPSKLNSSSPFEDEIRRRLWATILEIDLQVSLERGTSLPWTAKIEHEVFTPSNLNDVELHPHSKVVPSEKPFKTQTDCSTQRALHLCGKLRLQLLRETYSIESQTRINDPALTSRIMHSILIRLDGISSSPDATSWDPEPKRLLRLHVLRASLKAMHGLTSSTLDSGMLQNNLRIYYKYALEYLDIYWQLSPSARNGSLLSHTLFEALSPLIYISFDAFALPGVPSPFRKITDFVGSWSKYEFDDIDVLTDRELREKLMFFLLSHYLESKRSCSKLCSTRCEMASWRYGRLCLALDQRRRSPVFYIEISEMAFPKSFILWRRPKGLIFG